MIKDFKDIIKAIEEGMTNEEIIKERIDYLHSDEYKSKQNSAIISEGTGEISFYNGYIDKSQTVGISSYLEDTKYNMDDKEVFIPIIEAIRKNFQICKAKNQVPLSFIAGMVHNYFNKNTENEYRDFINGFKYLNQDTNYIRENIGEMINGYEKAKLSRPNLTCIEYFNIKTKFQNYKYKKQNNMTESITEDEREAFEFYSSIQSDVDQVKWEERAIKISSIRGLGIAQCTEYAALSQNILSFLGYNSFMLEGRAGTSNIPTQHHNYNVIEKDGKYYIFDSALRVYSAELNSIHKVEELLDFGEITLNLPDNCTATYFSNKKKRAFGKQDFERVAKDGAIYRTDARSKLNYRANYLDNRGR